MKKIFPLILAFALVLSLGASAFAAPHTGVEHGDDDGAIVSEDTGGSTQFYINVDKDASSDDNTTTSGETTGDFIDAADDRITYDITFNTTASYQLSVTVPLYVCMYAYGGDGTVVAPDSSAYILSNLSSSNDSATITIEAITKNTLYTPLLDESDGKPDNALIVGVSYDEDIDVYSYYYEELTDTTGLIYHNVVGEGYNPSGTWYVFYDIIGDTWDFKAKGALDDGVLKESVLSPDEITVTAIVEHKGVEFGITVYVGMSDSTGSEVGLPVKVTQIKSNAASWTLKSLTTAPTALLAGEIQMSLAPGSAVNTSAIDMSSALSSYDVSTNGWIIPAADLSLASPDPGTFGIDVFAQIAGGSVNEDGCVPVVSVSYTVVPVFGD